MRLLYRIVVALIAGLGIGAGSAFAQTNFTTVVVFGDSLSDTGNIANLVQSQYHVRFPADNPLLGLNYTDGRFTDGTDTQPPASTAYTGVWIEQLVKLFGTQVAVKDSLDGGTDYAYGDATTGNGTVTENRTFLSLPVSITLNNMGQQVTTYLGTNPTPNATTLYVLWGGGNDVLNAASSGADPVAAAQTAVANEIALIQRLRAAGATNFLIPNLPPLGAFAPGASPSVMTSLNNASGAFAVALTAGITALQQGAMGAPLKIYQPDILTLFGYITANPASFGFGNISSPAQGVTGSPDTYLSWDGLHPTTTGHHFVAATAASLIAPPIASATTLTAPAAALSGASLTVSASVASQRPNVIPTGLVVIFSGANVVGSAALDATGAGKVTFTPAAAAGSSLSLTATYAGDLNNTASTSAAQPVALLSAAVGTTTTVVSSAANANLGGAVTFTATVTPAVSTDGTPAGTVTFLDGTTTLGSGTLNGSGLATFTTSALAAGTHPITATYAGSGVFGGSTSAALSEVVTAPAYTAQASPASLSIASGNSGTVTLTAGAVGGYAGTITLSCGSLPSHLACAFSTTTLALSATSTSATSTLTIATNAMAALAQPDRPGAWAAPRVLSAGLLLPGAGALLLLSRRRRRAMRLRAVASTLLCVGLWGTAGCANNNNAPTGSYTVPVVFTPAAGGGTATTINVAVTVQ